MIRRPPRHRRSRKQIDPANPPIRPDVTAVLSTAAAKLRVTTTVPVQVNGLPNITVNGAEPTVVERVTALVFDLTYAGGSPATKTVIIPANCTHVRSEAGGFLVPQTVAAL